MRNVKGPADKPLKPKVRRPGSAQRSMATPTSTGPAAEMAKPREAGRDRDAGPDAHPVPHDAQGDAAGELSGDWREGELERFADRIEARIEACAPGFRGLVRRRRVAGPADLEEADRNLVHGAINGGPAQIFQLALFRPIPAQLGRPETPVRGLYLAGASAHPAGGVHGASGAIAARAALVRDAPRRLLSARGRGTRRSESAPSPAPDGS